MKRLTLALILVSSLSVYGKDVSLPSAVYPQDTIRITSPDTFTIILSDIMAIILSPQAIDKPDYFEDLTELPPLAQTEPVRTKAFSHLNLALRLSTMGVGLEAAAPLSGHVALRGGVNLLPVHVGYQSMSLLDEVKQLQDIQAAFGYVPKYRAKGDISLVNGHMLADYYPVKDGVFHLTAGLYMGTNTVDIKGFLSDNNHNPAQLKEGYAWPVVEYGGQRIDLTGGKLDFEMQVGKALKPYFGFGIGRSVTESRWGFKIDLGVIYQGDYSLKQNGKELKLDEAVIKDIVNIHDYTTLLKWWPMLNFQFTYRIF